MALDLTDDWYLATTDRIGRSALVACAALERVIEALEPGRAERIAGGSVVDITDHLMRAGAREVRRAAERAISGYLEAVHTHRVGVVQAIVDEEGLTLSEVARRIGVSRQMASRLYHNATRVASDRPNT